MDRLGRLSLVNLAYSLRDYAHCFFVRVSFFLFFLLTPLDILHYLGSEIVFEVVAHVFFNTKIIIFFFL